MSEEKVLTKKIAEEIIADEDSDALSEFTKIDDDAAEYAIHDGTKVAHPPLRQATRHLATICSTRHHCLREGYGTD